MAEESIPQFRSPLPNIGVGYSGGGGGGGMPQTTVAMEQLRKYVSEIGGSIVANRKLNIEKEIADAEMNVALGMVKPPTESMQENRLVMDKYNAVRARNFGIEDANLLLDQADTMVAESMEGFVFGSEDQESPAKKLVDKLEEFNAGTALREDRQEPTLLLNKNYTEQILMARQKVEGALRQEVQKESIRQRTIVAKSAIKNKLQELNVLLQTPQSPTFEVTKSISPNDFKRIYKELAPQFPLLGPQVEVLVYDQVISDSIETIENPAASDAEALMAYKMATALDQPGYARNNMSLAEIVQGRSKLTGPSSGVTKAKTALVKRIDDAQKKQSDKVALFLRTTSTPDLAKLSRSELKDYVNEARLEPGEGAAIMKRYDANAKTAGEKNRYRQALKHLMTNYSDAEILAGDENALATVIKNNFNLTNDQQSDIASLIKGRQELLQAAQDKDLEDTQKANYFNILPLMGHTGTEVHIVDMHTKGELSDDQRENALLKHRAFKEIFDKITDDRLREMFEQDMGRMDLPVGDKQGKEWAALLNKYKGNKELVGHLEKRKQEIRDFRKDQKEKAEENSLKVAQDKNFAEGNSAYLLRLSTNKNPYSGVDVLKGRRDGKGLNDEQVALLKFKVDFLREQQGETNFELFKTILDDPNLGEKTPSAIEGMIKELSTDQQTQVRKIWAAQKATSIAGQKERRDLIRGELTDETLISKKILSATTLNEDFQKKYGFSDTAMGVLKRRQERVKNEISLTDKEKGAMKEYLRLRNNPTELIKQTDLNTNKKLAPSPELAEKLIIERQRLLNETPKVTKEEKLNNEKAERAYAGHTSYENRQSVMDKEINKANYPALYEPGADPQFLVRLQEHRSGLLQARDERQVKIARSLKDFLSSQDESYLASINLDDFREHFVGDEAGDWFNQLKLQQDTIQDRRQKANPRLGRRLFWITGDNILDFDATKLGKLDKGVLENDDILELQEIKNKKLEAQVKEKRLYNFRMWENNPDLIKQSNGQIQVLTGDNTEETGILIAKRDELIYDRDASDEEKEFVSIAEDFFLKPSLFEGMSLDDVKETLEWTGKEPLTAHANAQRNKALVAYRDHIETKKKNGSDYANKEATVFISQMLLEPDFKKDVLFNYITEQASLAEGEGIGTSTFRNLRDDIEEAVKARETDFAKWENSTTELFNNYIQIPHPDNQIWQTILGSPTGAKLQEVRSNLRIRFRKFLQGVYEINKDKDFDTLQIQQIAEPELIKLEQELQKQIPDYNKTVLERMKEYKTNSKVQSSAKAVRSVLYNIDPTKVNLGDNKTKESEIE